MSDPLSAGKKTGHEPSCHCAECYAALERSGTLYRDLWCAAKEEAGGDPIQVVTRLRKELREARRFAEAYREVWEKCAAAVELAPNPDPLPWAAATGK